MKRFGLRARMLATGLSALAGFVDAVGYLTLGGFFVSFMSGNTTRLAVGIATHGRDAALAGALIFSFFIGVVAMTLVGRAMRRNRERHLLIALALTLVMSALLISLGQPLVGCLVAAFAMGSENVLFERDGEVAVGLTYMTGTLVKCGQRLARALAGEDRWAWVPFLALWLGLASGAVAGAFAFHLMGGAAMWVAALAAGAMAMASFAVDLE